MGIVEGREEVLSALAKYTDRYNLDKLSRIKSINLLKWIVYIAELTKPSRIFIITDSEQDIEYIKSKAIENKEEIPSRFNPRHTVHFDGPRDLARDRENTRILVPAGVEIPMINTKERNEALREVLEYFNGIMKDKELYIGLYCYGPKNSPFSLYGVQVTDSGLCCP
jgi:phosphoenolpyruvate carboxykinase (GTP)